MKIGTPTTLLSAAAAVATAGAVAFVAAPLSSAEDVTATTVGSQAKLVDGNVIQGWTITDLRPSSDAIPYPVAGTLWEATATDEAIQGSATPIVSNLNARAKSGENYRVLFGVATPQGVNPATLAEGEKTTGKVYFDVTGDAPDAVVYNAGGQDRLAWAQAAPAPRNQGSSQWTPPARSQVSPAPAATPATPTPAAVEGATPTTTAAPAPGAPMPASAEAVPGAPLPAGSQGTPLPAGSAGTPLPAGSQGTPLPEGAPAAASVEGAPQPASTKTTPLPAGSQGTPVTPSAAPTAPATPVTTVPPAPTA
ncbi:MPT63 family protein [Mycobacterium sp. 3519A]|uniref:MPT63 family protein n=1 Tax=Mycobacterium sp. 3519A TaxID=2057184 RepID=UPI000C7C4EE0|nr:MPT63 family protein [Mycobacterium sp. 3519A]